MFAKNQRSEDVALSLTVAVVSSSPGPLLLLDGEFAVVAASLSFCDAFETSRADLAGRSLYSLGIGEWDVPELRELMAAVVANADVEGPREIDFGKPRSPSRRLLVQARRLAYLDLEQTRVLVAVSDVTDSQADEGLKDEALRKNSVLLQEVRHRVANSLQIIASVLMQNARKTESEETRAHLKDAHNRVMSVAALERLLSTSRDGEVEVHAYFTSLCDTIAASMIGDNEQVALIVEGDEALVEARVSVSLGLIVTELVINALKHAFPDGRPGKITVDYNFHGPNWVLCVRDDGIGTPPPGAAVRTGLGTSIVEALATQLDATVEVTLERPGTKICVHHTSVALVQGEAQTGNKADAAALPPEETKRRMTSEERP